MKKPDSELKY